MTRKNAGRGFVFSALIFGLLLIYFIYSLTIGRGAEYSWNGKIFY
jgi:hypothetical protein